jgi:hypothetical protein
MLYHFALWAHSWLRWAVAASGAASRGFAPSDGKTARRRGRRRTELWSLLLTICVDLQFRGGCRPVRFLEYPLSGRASGILVSQCRSMSVRFFMIEHVIGMVAGIRALVHIAGGSKSGRRLTRSASTGSRVTAVRNCARPDLIVSIPVAGHARVASAVPP